MRRQDWVGRLWRTVKNYEHTPFQYGKHDCCLFVARCIDSITYSSLARTMNYGDERGAVCFLRQEGGLINAVTRRLGTPINGINARRGDVCLVQCDSSDGLGVCMGSTIAVAAEDGLVFYPLRQSKKVWRVD